MAVIKITVGTISVLLSFFPEEPSIHHYAFSAALKRQLRSLIVHLLPKPSQKIKRGEEKWCSNQKKVPNSCKEELTIKFG